MNPHFIRNLEIRKYKIEIVKKNGANYVAWPVRFPGAMPAGWPRAGPTPTHSEQRARAPRDPQAIASNHPKVERGHDSSDDSSDRRDNCDSSNSDSSDNK